MKKLLLATFAVLPLCALSQTFTYTGNLSIPDNATEVCLPVVVSGLPTVINSSFGLSGMCFDITHTYDSDLQIRLKSPNGNSIFLANGVGGEFDNFTGTCIAENGVNGFLVNGSAPFTGIWIPLESLNLLNNGQNPNGTWLFCVTDVAAVDTGSIHSVTLTFSNNPPPDPPPPPPLCTFCTCPGGVPTCDLLPDMTASELIISNDINPFTHQSIYEIPGNINFDNATPNIGWGPLEIHGVDSCYCDSVLVPCTTTSCPSGNPVKHVVHQVIYHRQNNNDSLTSYERNAGFMSYHPTHGHIHVDHWADFTLRKATSNPDATTWPIVGTGTKQSFCLINLGSCDGNFGYCVDTNGTQLHNADIPNSGFGYVSGCGLEQGIYVGSLDIYVVGLNTGIDLTGVCNGDYYIVSITDPENNMLESNENNNWAAVPVTLFQQAPSPSADFVSIPVGTQVALNATNLVNVTSFTWDFGDGSVDSTNNPTIHNYTANGTYIITLTVNSPCGIFIQSDTVNITTVSITENSIPDEYFLKSQPNPAKGITELSYFVMHDNDPVKMELYNTVGQKIKTLINEPLPNGRHTLNLDFKAAKIDAGNYFVKFTSPDKSMTIRLIVME
ncbi:MAG TPA: PKD domain-containing protein [Bacteroidia bacterium]|nr:PKD domain-containing protein [Bacteroidia bacterium]